MIAVWRWLKRWWWSIVVGFASVFGFLFWFLLPRSRSNNEETPLSQAMKPPTLKERAREEVERIHLEGEIEKARVKAVVEYQKKQLNIIEKLGEKKPAMARRRLATWLRENL